MSTSGLLLRCNSRTATRPRPHFQFLMYLRHGSSRSIIFLAHLTYLGKPQVSFVNTLARTEYRASFMLECTYRSDHIPPRAVCNVENLSPKVVGTVPCAHRAACRADVRGMGFPRDTRGRTAHASSRWRTVCMIKANMSIYIARPRANMHELARPSETSRAPPRPRALHWNVARPSAIFPTAARVQRARYDDGVLRGRARLPS